MKTTKTLLGLALASTITLTEAVDCHIHATTQCSGSPYVICTNLVADVCCNAVLDGHSGATSGALLNLPSGSSFSGYTPSSTTPCGHSLGLHYGPGNFCLNPPYGTLYTGFAWFSGSGKMKRTAGQECKGKVDPDRLVFASGETHSLEGLTGAEKAELWNRAMDEWRADQNIITDVA